MPPPVTRVPVVAGSVIVVVPAISAGFRAIVPEVKPLKVRVLPAVPSNAAPEATSPTKVISPAPAVAQLKAPAPSV